jgi:hypothetical protein
MGRIEDADQTMHAQNGIAAPESARAIEEARLTAAVQSLRYQKCLHAGQYRAAGEVLEGAEGRGV